MLSSHCGKGWKSFNDDIILSLTLIFLKQVYYTSRYLLQIKFNVFKIRSNIKNWNVNVFKVRAPRTWSTFHSTFMWPNTVQLQYTLAVIVWKNSSIALKWSSKISWTILKRWHWKFVIKNLEKSENIYNRVNHILILVLGNWQCICVWVGPQRLANICHKW